LKKGVAEERDCYYFQEIGYSRKVAIARARELDMLVCRHAWEGEVVESLGEAASRVDVGFGDAPRGTGGGDDSGLAQAPDAQWISLLTDVKGARLGEQTACGVKVFDGGSNDVRP
jgi:hypothetical protein